MAYTLIKKLHSLFDRKFVNQVESNFEDVERYMNKNEDYKTSHKSTEKEAHNTKQIVHELEDGLKSTSANELLYQRKQIEKLVLGHNGDGVQEVRASRTSMDAKGFDSLSNRLYHDFLNESNKREAMYKELLAKIQREVHVDDYGADPTGQKDSSKAIETAIGDGKVKVNFSSGVYLIDKGIKLPNFTRLVGQGKGVTVIRLSKNAARKEIGITNLKMSGEAQDIAIEDLDVDGNKEERFPGEKHETGGVTYSYPDAAGGSLSSNIRLAGVTNGYVKNVRSYDAILHGIDVTFASDDYYYQGDGNRVDINLESQHIWIEGCETYGFGDDGITTHHSRYITISNCYSHSPKNLHGNSNGFEIDDGSQYVFMSDNMSYGCYSGLEIKAHGDTSAAAGVFVNNHMSIKDCRSFNPRHIGHHRKATDAKSKTAKNIVLNNCVALFPTPNGIYKGYTTRALVISAYQNVQVNNFTAIGDSNFSSDVPVVAVQFMSENVNLSNLNIMNFPQAQADIKIFGGTNKGNHVTITNPNIVNSSKQRGIAGGSGFVGAKVIGGNLQGQGTGNGVESYNNKMEFIGLSVTGYENAALIAGEKYSVMPTVVKGGFSGGSTGSAAIAERSAVIASTGGTKAHSDRSFTLGSGSNSSVYGSRSGIITSLNSQIPSGGHTRMIIASNRVKNTENYHIKAGYAASGDASESNVKVDLSTYSGNLTLAGKLTQDGADYAEYFETQSGAPIELGMIVALDGDKIRKAQPSDNSPLGIISGTATVIGDGASFHHKDRYLKNEYGITITEEIEKTYTDDDGNEYTDIKQIPIENPDYNEDVEYRSRAERDEWQAVGLLGKIYTNVDKNVKVGDSLKASAGIGYTDPNGRGKVMAITTPYTEERGHAIALVMWF